MTEKRYPAAEDFKASPRAFEDVPVSELGGDAHLRIQVISVKERLEFEAAWAERPVHERAALAVIYTAVHPDKPEPMFTLDDLAWLAEQAASTWVSRAWAVADRLNGFTPAQVTAAAKN